MKIIFIILLSLSLFSCSKKQPSEIDKADITKIIIQCITKVTFKEGDKPENFFDAMSNLTNSLSGMKDVKKDWELREDGSVILNLDTEETLYSCNYIKNNEEKWFLNTVLRNNEKVFSYQKDKTNRDAMKAKKAAKEKKEQEEYVST